MWWESDFGASRNVVLPRFFLAHRLVRPLERSEIAWGCLWVRLGCARGQNKISNSYSQFGLRGRAPRGVTGELSPASVYVSLLPVVEACVVVAVPGRVGEVRVAADEPEAVDLDPGVLARRLGTSSTLRRKFGFTLDFSDSERRSRGLYSTGRRVICNLYRGEKERENT